MNVGLLGGSFDPPHIGHLIIANYMVEFTDLEEVWLMISPQNPLKIDKHQSDELIRLEMVKLAAGLHSKIKASDFELYLDRPSYTYSTMRALSMTYPQHNFSLLIGSDNMEIFSSWKNHLELLEKYRIFVYPRSEINAQSIDNLYYVPAPKVELSSTLIRNSIKQGKNMNCFLPNGVYDFIKEKGLYL